MENNTEQVKKFFYVILALVVVLVTFFLLTKKKNVDTQADSQYQIGQANVESFDIVLKESFPVQIDLMVKGSLPDGCTTLGDVKQSLVGKTFNVKLETRKLKDVDVVCTQALVPFEERISLENVVGITAGEYTVNLNGISKNFTMDVDNYITNEDPLK